MSTTSSSDRNLLFGVLALQMDFISRDALMKGMNAWVLEKTKPLGRILTEQGALRADLGQFVEAMIDKHLETHNNNPHESLAAVSAFGSVRQDLESIADADLEKNLAQLPLAPRENGIPATISYALGISTSAGTRFRILRPHARGGLGEVFVAQDQELNREVAIKEIQERYAGNPESRARFLREAEITGGLEHPGIVPVYGLGAYPDGRPFYAMRFIKGASLKDAIEHEHFHDKQAADEGERTIEFRKLLGRFVDVCNAIAYAHSRGVLHRDLKPGNIMLGKYGETLVVDWGLAKPVERPEAATDLDEHTLRPSSASGSAETQAGSAIGTPQYMSPEQAAGRLDLLGPASDVYSLGATLYCLLTGKAPFEGKDVGAVLQQVRRGDFPKPRRIQTDVPPALEAICLKAMALEPKDRYAVPRALADDIEHWLADEPVSAWVEPWTVKGRRWVGRHRVLFTGAAAAALVGLVSLLIATGLLTAANENLVEAKDKADEQKRKAEGLAIAMEQERDRAAQALAISTTNLALNRLNERNLALAQELLEEVPSRFRWGGWHYLKKQVAGSYCTLYGHVGAIRNVAFSPDGLQLASAGQDKMVKVWDVKNGQEILTLRGHKVGIKSVIFSPDGLLLASAGEDQTVKIWDATSGREVRTLRGHTSTVSSVSFSSDGLLLASASEDETVKLWDVKSGQEVRTLRGHTNIVTSVAFSPDGLLLASAAVDGTVKLWNSKTGQTVRTLSAHDPAGTANAIRSVAFSPDGLLLATANDDQTVKLWDAHGGQEVRTLRTHTGLVTSVAFSPDGVLLASAGYDNTVKVGDTKSGQEIVILRGHTNAVLGVTFSPDGQLLASASSDGTVKLWNARSSQHIRALWGHNGPVTSVAFSPDGVLLASGSYDTTVKLWDSKSGQENRTLRGHDSVVLGLTFSPDGLLLASASGDRTLKLWDVKSGKEIRTFRGHASAVFCVTFSADGHLLASGGGDNTVKLWETKSGKEIGSSYQSDPVSSVVFSADGRLLASGSGNGTIGLWDAKSGKAIQTFNAHAGGVRALSFSVLLASAGHDNTVKLWNCDSLVQLWEATKGRQSPELKPICTLRGHTREVSSVAFSPRGLLASASGDETVNLWDAKSGQQVRALGGHSAVMSVSFSPDGLLLASAAYDGKVRLWDARAGQEENEVSFRELMASPDPFWHREQCQRQEKEGRRFAAAFHRDRLLKLDERTLGVRKAKLGPDHPDSVMAMWDVAQSLTKLGRGAEAVAILDEHLQRASADAVDCRLISRILELRLRHFEKTKNAAGCRTTAEILEKLKRINADSLYSAACFRAVTAAVIRASGRPADIKQADAEADRAMSWLLQAVAAGFNNVAHMKHDKDLDSLRGREDFKKLVAELENRKAKGKK
jgi:WD40 repeat protein/tRNA A-37 threonylcarbamoyl transferase component Bud32